MLIHTDLMKGCPCNEPVIGQHIKNRCSHLISNVKAKGKVVLIHTMKAFRESGGDDDDDDDDDCKWVQDLYQSRYT